MRKSIPYILIVPLIILFGCQLKKMDESDYSNDKIKKRIKPNGEGWVLAVPGIKDRIDRNLYEVVVDNDRNKWWREYIYKYGFKSNVSENCFWCGRSIDLNTCGVVILYNKNKNTEFIPDNFSMILGQDTSKIKNWSLFRTEILCSHKCYKEIKNTYFKDLKDNYKVCDRGNGKWDYYYYPF